MTTIIALDKRNKRRRTRRVDLDALVDRAREIARGRENRRAIVAKHGGTVPNNYNYPAITDAVVVAVLDQTAVVWVREIPAKKATLSGVLARCLGEEARAMLDDRCGEDRRADARAYIYGAALEHLQNQLHAHIKLDVKKHFSLLVADAQARTAIHKARFGD